MPLNIFLVVILTTISGLLSGLTLGLMSLSTQELEREIKISGPDAKAAKKVLPLRRKGNQLLATLLIANTAVNSILSIFLSSLASGLVAVIGTTVLLFLFGEVLPQALISRHALRFGAALAWLVKGFMILFWVVGFPIGWLLDKLLGQELHSFFTKKELIALISEHQSSANVDADEERIMHGALLFSDKTVADIMTPRTHDVIAMVRDTDVLTNELRKKLVDSGNSRFPVVSESSIDDVVGVLHIRDLVLAQNKITIGEIMSGVHFVTETMKLDELLNAFLTYKQHLFVVQDTFAAFTGVVTLEDVTETILQVEIVDEDDRHEDMRKLATDRVRA